MTGNLYGGKIAPSRGALPRAAGWKRDHGIRRFNSPPSEIGSGQIVDDDDQFMQRPCAGTLQGCQDAVICAAVLVCVFHGILKPAAVLDIEI